MKSPKTLTRVLLVTIIRLNMLYQNNTAKHDIITSSIVLSIYTIVVQHLLFPHWNFIIKVRL